MSVESKDVEKGGSAGSSWATMFGALALALAILYVGGWAPIWEGQLGGKSFVLNAHVVAVRFNNLYYGASLTNRFFDSPVLSWACFMLALGLKPAVFVFFGSNGDDNGDDDD